ncbi:MAG: pilus assembly protein N-terminal domain-containing protein [Hyphomicrobiaceae bacterium]
MPAKAICRFAHVVIAMFALAPAAVAGDLVVKYDQSQLLRVPRPVSSIIIGNPSIADVTVQSPNLLVVTGRTFGITNVIALDADRNVIQDQRVVVVRDGTSQVSLYRGTKRETYNCAPHCNPSLMAGDDAKYFGEVKSGFEGKTQFSDKAADGSGGHN